MKVKKRFWLPLAVLVAGFLIPDPGIIPVAGASRSDWHADTFWFEPWGSSVTHKGIDIFGDKGTSVIAAGYGIRLFEGTLPKGGKVLVYLGPRWRIHYYAHVDSFATSPHWLVSPGDKIATLGDSGNARGKPPHLHYSLLTLVPYPWRIDQSTQGWKKSFYLNPVDHFD